MKVLFLKILFLLFTLVLFSCEGDPDEASCKILLQVAHPEFYKGCTIPISVLALDGKTLVKEVNLFLDDEDMGSMETSPYIYYWDTDGYPEGEHRINVSYTSSSGAATSDELVINILPVCVTCPDEVTDFEGNDYPVVRIGNQCWMAENMRSTHFPDGAAMKNGNDSIGDFLSSSFAILPEELIGWYFAYDGDSIHAKQYGYLYTWGTIVNGTEGLRDSSGNIQGMAPDGWHVPEVEEWQALIDYLGGVEIAGEKLKDLNSPLWRVSSPDHPNASGFAALPGGCCLYNNSYLEEGETSYFWTATPSIVNHAYHIVLPNRDSRANVLGHQDSKRFGYSLRCVMN